MAKYVVAAIAGVVLIMVLTYVAGLWSERAGSDVDMTDVADREIVQEGSKSAKRKQAQGTDEEEPEPEPEPQDQAPPPVPPYPHALPDKLAAVQAKLEKKIDFETENTPFREAVEKLAEIVDIEVRFNDGVLEGTFPVSYKVEKVPAWHILRDLLFTADADYYWEPEGIYVALKEDMNIPEELAAAHAIEAAMHRYFGNAVLFAEVEVAGKPLHVLQQLMSSHSVMPSKKALAAVAGLEEEVSFSGGYGDVTSEILAKLGIGAPAIKLGSLDVLLTGDELAVWKQWQEDIRYAYDDFYQRAVDGEIKNMQLYRIGNLLEGKTGVPVLLDKQAWEYVEFFTILKKSPTVKEVLGELEVAGFVNILLVDEQTRRERLFIFEKPE